MGGDTGKLELAETGLAGADDGGGAIRLLCRL